MKLDRFHGGLILAALFAFALAANEWKSSRQSNGALQGVRARESIALAQLAEAKLSVRVQSDTVVRYTQQVRLIRDTLLQHLTDTISILVYVHAVDSAMSACDALRRSCLLLGAVTDSVLAAKDAHIHILEAIRPHWWDRIGVNAGYGVTKVGHDVVAGPQVGLSVRVWP